MCLCDFIANSPYTIEILNIGTDRQNQIAQTQIRLLLLGSTLFAIPSASFGRIIALKHQTFFYLYDNCVNNFRCPKFYCI